MTTQAARQYIDQRTRWCFSLHANGKVTVLAPCSELDFHRDIVVDDGNGRMIDHTHSHDPAEATFRPAEWAAIVAAMSSESKQP